MALFSSQVRNGCSVTTSTKFFMDTVSGHGSDRPQPVEEARVRRDVGERQALGAGEGDADDPEHRVGGQQREDGQEHVQQHVRAVALAPDVRVAHAFTASVARVIRVWKTP